MIILFLTEIFAYIRVQRTESITVRKHSEDRLFIDFNLTMYNITCRSTVWPAF